MSVAEKIAAPGLDAQHSFELEEQRRRARELQRGIAAGDGPALARLRRHHPRAAGLPDTDLVVARAHLDDAQLVIARELGLPSWPAVVAHACRLDAARRALEAGGDAPDADVSTLHLRCGSDIRDTLRRAGFAGDFLEVSDPICQGPVPEADDLCSVRADFLANAYGVPPDEARARLDRESAALAQAPDRYSRIVLWFEHDPYDQLILARILAFLAKAPRQPTVELICVDRFPPIQRFIGLGQLGAVELRSLWPARKPVTDVQLNLGTAVWSALRRPDPKALHAIASTGTPELPAMAPALCRHLQELPWTGNGLSLTERLALSALQSWPMTVEAVFRTLHRETEPLPFLGDLMFWATIEAMMRAERPPIAADPATADEPWARRRLVLTGDGYDILDRHLDWLACRPPERWVGGVAIRSGEPVWRWSPDRAAPVKDGD